MFRSAIKMDPMRRKSKRIIRLCTANTEITEPSNIIAMNKYKLK